MSLQTWFNQVWYARRHAPLWLLPLSGVFAAGAALRRFAYGLGLRKRITVGVPVIVVGNLTVGGTGKTPLVCWLTNELSKRGYRPGIATRGYGGEEGHARLLTVADSASAVGDEPLLLARHCSAPVAVGRQRVTAALLLVEQGCNVIVCDDGLQHLALDRDCEIVVIDGVRGFGNGHLLPAGPLRESPQRLERVDAVVVNGGGSAFGESSLPMRLEGDEAVALRGGQRRALADWGGRAVHAVAGIGNPQRFFNALRAYGLNVEGHALADHAPIRAADIRFNDAYPVLLTEKDAVKCAEIADERHWYVPVSAVFEPDDAERLMAIVESKLRARSGG